MLVHPEKSSAVLAYILLRPNVYTFMLSAAVYDCIHIQGTIQYFVIFLTDRITLINGKQTYRMARKKRASSHETFRLLDPRQALTFRALSAPHCMRVQRNSELVGMNAGDK